MAFIDKIPTIRGVSLLQASMDSMILDHLGGVFDAQPATWTGYQAADGDPPVIIASASDYPAEGTTTLSTVGTSNYPLHQKDGTISASTRVEFVASCLTGQERDLALALCSAARFVVDVKGFVCPGMFLYELIGQFRDGCSVPHGFLVTPFAYHGLNEHDPFGDRVISWLQIIPVSSNEITYARRLSSHELEELFARENIDWESLDRLSVL